ncbi:unnamed protein product [Protopolystoma xenopodis]|uniref:Phosphatidic acid phosphatase type 2/haloperoxidase domain-containing protein n=1 Tax=Protopolystoma xenopodis TaxID=117903 RepID=A0A448XHB8_9PLAT|nr:unnamed protein product [Protopolystoma xenopodis]
MPSNHAQFMSFFSSYFTLFLVLRLSKGSIRSFYRIFVILFILLLTFVTCFSRVYLLYHDVNQVICGLVVGAILGSTWFLLVNFVFTPHFPAIANSFLGNLFMLQDHTMISNIMLFEYICCKNENR